MSRRSLTPKQRDFLGYIRSYIKKYGEWPTYRDIIDHFDFRSPTEVGDLRSFIEGEFGGETIGFLDFGMTGRVDDATSEKFEGVLGALLSRDDDEMVHYLLQMGEFPPDLDRDDFQRAVSDYIAEYVPEELSDLDLTSAANAATDLVREHHIVLDPAYDSYEPAVTLAGGLTRHVPLRIGSNGHDFHPDWQRIADAMTPRTRLIILNFPHNPTGAILSADDLDVLAEQSHGEPAVSGANPGSPSPDPLLGRAG